MARDDRLLRRVMVTTLVVTVIVFGALEAYFPWEVGVSFVLGVAAGVGSFALLHQMVAGVGRAGSEGKSPRVAGMALLYVGKYLIIGAVFYLLFISGRASIPAIAAGFTLPTAVLCLKEAGRRVNKAVGIEPKTDAANAGGSGSGTVDSTDGQ